MISNTIYLLFKQNKINKLIINDIIFIQILHKLFNLLLLVFVNLLKFMDQSQLCIILVYWGFNYCMFDVGKRLCLLSFYYCCSLSSSILRQGCFETFGFGGFIQI